MAPITPPGSLAYSPATMSVKSKPFFTDFRCTWLGSVAKPTYCLSISWGQGQGQSGVCWGSWAAPCPVPYPAQAKVGHFNGRKGVRACGQRPGSGRVGQGLAGEGTLVPASVWSFAGNQDCVYVCVCMWSGRCQASADTDSVLPWGVDRRHKNGDPSDMPLSSQAGEAQASILTPP